MILLNIFETLSWRFAAFIKTQSNLYMRQIQSTRAAHHDDLPQDPLFTMVSSQRV